MSTALERQCRGAEIAAHRDLQTGFRQQMAEQRGGGRFSVGPGDGHRRFRLLGKKARRPLGEAAAWAEVLVRDLTHAQCVLEAEKIAEAAWRHANPWVQAEEESLAAAEGGSGAPTDHAAPSR